MAGISPRTSEIDLARPRDAYSALNEDVQPISDRHVPRRRRWRILALVAISAIAGISLYCTLCTLAKGAPRVSPSARPERPSKGDPALHVLIVGDWGGEPWYPYVGPGQLKVRDQMAALARASGARRQLVLALGDNFYNSGTRDINDKRFESTFENVYTRDHPELAGDDMWRLVAGNHDYGQNVSAQIAYTDKSRPWFFPSEYYSFTETLGPVVPGRPSATAEFVMVDTVMLCGGERGFGLEGPEAEARAEEHWEWLNATLAASKAEFLIVAGHYPVWSVGLHGPTPLLVRRLRPLLEAHGVTAYLSGHDHMSQLLHDNGVDYHGVGGGLQLNYGVPHRAGVPQGALRGEFSSAVWPINPFMGSFASASFTHDALTVVHFDSDGRALFQSVAAPRAQR